MTQIKNRTKHTIILGVSTSIQIVTLILRTKLITILLPINGVAIYTQTNNIITFVNNLTNFNIRTLGLSLLSEDSKSQELLNKTLTLSGLLGFFVSIISFLLLNHQFKLDYSVYQILLISFSIILFQLSNFKPIYLQAANNIKYTFFYNIINSLLPSVISLIPIFLYKSKGIVLCVSMFYLIQFIIAGKLNLKINSLFKLNKELIFLFKKGVVININTIIFSGNILFITNLISLKNDNLLGVVNYNICFSIINYFSTIVISNLHYSVFNEFKTKSYKEALIFLKTLYKNSIFIVLPILLFLSIFSKEIILSLFSIKVIAAGEMLLPFLIGLFIKSLTIPYSYFLIHFNYTSKFFISELILNIVFLISSIFILNKFPINYIGWSYSIAYCIFLITIIIIIKKIYLCNIEC